MKTPSVPLGGVGGTGNRTMVRVPQTRGFDAPGYFNVRAERVARAVGALSVERGPGVRETPLLRQGEGTGRGCENPGWKANSATKCRSNEMPPSLLPLREAGRVFKFIIL